MRNYDYKKMEYPLEFLLKMAKKGNWAWRELKLNGYLDESERDYGEPNKGDVQN